MIKLVHVKHLRAMPGIRALGAASIIIIIIIIIT